MSSKINTSKGVALWNRAKKIIPGGSQLLSKRSEMFLPDQWPSYYQKAKGVEILDLNNNKLIDMSIMGVGACILGYADPDVNRAVKRAIENGSMSTLNCPEEVELAELLCQLHPWAKMVRYARAGGEAMSIAVRIARAHTGKDRVILCGYHGWTDWYMAANLIDRKTLNQHLLPELDPAGVPKNLQGLTLSFSYNKIKELEDIVSNYNDIAAIVVEPLRHDEPQDNFLKKVEKIANKIGAVLILDEISIGWRINVGGVHLMYGIEPDIAVFAKAISNGFPMAAIIGKENVMQAAQKSFISSTYWTERIGPVAALATIRKMQEINVQAHLKKIGSMIEEGWKKLAIKHNLKIKIMHPEALITFIFDYGSNNQALKTLFTQEMLARGFLASGSVYVSLAHKESHVKKYLMAVDEVFAILRKAVGNQNIEKLLKGPIAHDNYKRVS